MSKKDELVNAITNHPKFEEMYGTIYDVSNDFDYEFAIIFEIHPGFIGFKEGKYFPEVDGVWHLDGLDSVEEVIEWLDNNNDVYGKDDKLDNSQSFAEVTAPNLSAEQWKTTRLWVNSIVRDLPKANEWGIQSKDQARDLINYCHKIAFDLTADEHYALIDACDDEGALVVDTERLQTLELVGLPNDGRVFATPFGREIVRFIQSIDEAIVKISRQKSETKQ